MFLSTNSEVEEPLGWTDDVLKWEIFSWYLNFIENFVKFVINVKYLTLLNDHAFSIQDEKYNHIDESEMKKVEKSVNEVMEWMNNVMNEQARKSLDQDPVIRAQEIKAKIKVSVIVHSSLYFLRGSSYNHLNPEHGHFSHKSFPSSWPKPDFLVYNWYHKI